MSDETNTTDIPEDDKVAASKIEPEQPDTDTRLTDVISRVENHHSILKSQANAIIAITAFLCLLAVAYTRQNKALSAFIMEVTGDV